jgi:hypothetical protein
MVVLAARQRYASASRQPGLSERFFGSRSASLSITRNFGQALRLRPKSDSEGNPSGGPPSP